MDRDEGRPIVARKASGRISRREVIALPMTPGFTSRPLTTPTPHSDTGHRLKLFDIPPRTVADGRRVR